MNAKRSIADHLLAWYDAHRRALPWRARPGETPDPYRVWLSEVMLQQTTVAAVVPRFAAWLARWPDFASLAVADEAEVMAAWAGLGYYARARNLLRAARAVAERGGFPDTEVALRALPGIGDYTAAAIAAIAFGRRAVVVDANVERVVARLFAIPEPLPKARPAIRAAADAITPDERAGDFAQAMMDLGATICTPRAPRCLLCPLRAACDGFAGGAPERFPVKPAKRKRPQRYATAFWLTRSTTPVRPEPVEGRPVINIEGRTSTSSVQPEDREVLLVRREGRGMLGGMRALPTGPWAEVPPGLAEPPAEVEWQLLDTTVRHVFTHFRLDLALAVATGEAHGADGEWWPVDDLAAAGLPTLFAKAAEAVRSKG